MVSILTMMGSRLILLGDYFHGLGDLYEHLEDKYDVYPICFLDTVEYNDTSLPREWKVIDFRDFHELTISIMEIEPEVVVYLSPYLRDNRAELNPDLAEMANVEALQHLKETLGIHNTHLIIIWKSHQEVKSKVLANTLQQGQEMVAGMGRYSIIQVPEIIDTSPEGYYAWISSRSSKIDKNVIGVKDLFEEIKSVIENSKTGVITATRTKQPGIPDFSDIEFQGEDENFT